MVDRNIKLQPDEDLAKTILKRYKVLKELYLTGESTLTVLSDRLEMNIGNLSKYITDLQRRGLIVEREEERTGRPYKYISLSRNIAPIISSLIDAVKPVQTNYKPWAVELCLDIVEDEQLNENTRKEYAESLRGSFEQMPEILTKHQRLREFLDKATTNPKANDEIEQLKRSMIKTSVARLVSYESTRSWVVNFVYPNISKLLENMIRGSDMTKSEGIVEWTISTLGEIGTGSPNSVIRNEIRDKLVKIFFDETLELKSETAGELIQSILGIITKEPQSIQEFAGDLRKRAKVGSESEKSKALLLLEKILEKLATPRIGINQPSPQ